MLSEAQYTRLEFVLASLGRIALRGAVSWVWADGFRRCRVRCRSA